MISRDECERRCMQALRDILEEVHDDMDSESPGWLTMIDAQYLISSFLDVHRSIEDMLDSMACLYERATGRRWEGSSDIDDVIHELRKYYSGTLDELSKED